MIASSITQFVVSAALDLLVDYGKSGTRYRVEVAGLYPPLDRSRDADVGSATQLDGADN